MGWRSLSGTSYGSTVFYYNLEESDSISEDASQAMYELKFKAQLYSPYCRICGRKEFVEATYK